MDQTNEPKNLEESVAQVLKTLPPVVREYVGNQRYTPVAQALVAKYSLHIDQGGVLERGIMLLLMGVDTPDEFTQALKDDARLDDATIESIAQDINEQIFIPLRKAEQDGGLEEKTPPPAVSIAPAMPASPVVRAAPEPLVHHEAPSVSILPPKQPSTAAAPTLSPSTAAVPPTPLPPKMTMPQRPQNAPEIAPENLPGAMAAPGAAGVINPGMAVPPAPAPVQKAPPKPIVKSYAVDPYREPFEDLDENV